MDNEVELEKERAIAEARKELQTPHKVWFIERIGDGYIFACKEIEAWEILNNKSTWRRRDFRIVGVGDGMTLARYLKEGKQKKMKIKKELAEAQEEERKYLKTEDRLIFEELLPKDDEKVKRARELREKASGRVMKLRKELADISQNIYKKAFEAELEAARGKIEFPRNVNIITPYGERDKVLQAMGKAETNEVESLRKELQELKNKLQNGKD